VSALAHIPQDLEPISNGELSALLKSAEEEEQRVSDLRRRLHGRIDTIQINAGAIPEYDAELLPSLLEEERHLSEYRLHLHQQITEIRLERGRRAARLRSPLHAVS